MARPRKNGVRLSTLVPPKVLADLKVQAASINGSVGDAVARLHAQSQAPEAYVASLLESVKDSHSAEAAALQVARAAVRRAEKAEARLFRMSAASKAAYRHNEMMQ